MQNNRDEMFLIEQSLKNLGFMIQLQVHLVSTMPDNSPEAAREAADLRRMMELEEVLRARQLTAARTCRIQVAA